MDVVSAEQAKVAEEAGACAVMALERVPADIRRDGGIARMTDPEVGRDTHTHTIQNSTHTHTPTAESEGYTGCCDHPCHGEM